MKVIADETLFDEWTTVYLRTSCLPAIVQNNNNITRTQLEEWDATVNRILEDIENLRQRTLAHIILRCGNK
jgi:hypothetical protein